jgi:hypothetical protein
MKRLAKEDILKGKDVRETITIESYEREVVIRPLTDGELSEILAMIGGIPIKSDGTPDPTMVDVGKNFQALRLAASLGLVEPHLTLDEVAEMKFGVPEYIGSRVLEISGISSRGSAKKKAEIEGFVESPEGQELAALCLDYGYKLARSPADLTRHQINFLMAALADRLEKLAVARAGQDGVNRFIFVEDRETED